MDTNSPNTLYQIIVCANSAGFFCADLIQIILTPSMYEHGLAFHHLMCFAFLLQACFCNNWGAVLCFICFIGEWTHPFLQISCILKSIGKRYTRSFYYSKILFIATMFLTRFIIYPLFIIFCST